MAEKYTVTLKERMEKTGSWLFRWRSYLPIACAGIILPALRNFKNPYGSHQLDQLWEILCLAISLMGLSVRILTVGYTPHGTSGRNSKEQKAYVLNTTGMYSLMRHPLYFGNSLTWLGVSLFARLWWLTFILLLVFWIYYERIMLAEEEFLRKKFGQDFIEWAHRTPVFLPRLYHWKSPSLPFSWRTVLKREHTTFFLIIVMFAAMEEGSSLMTRGTFELDLMWIILFSAGLAQYVFLRTLKKYSTLLDIPGR